MRIYQALFFDFDGVIVDSVDVKTDAFAELFSEHGKDVQQKVIDYHLANGGKTRREKIKHMHDRFLNRPVGSDELDRLCSEFSKIVTHRIIRAAEIPGAEAFIRKWNQSVPCFVVSATPKQELETIMAERNILHHFKEVMGSDRSKTDHINDVLDRYDFDRSRCIFFGDAENDYRAARECHVRFIGVASRHTISIKGMDKIFSYLNFHEISI
jgi:beta-phosphoglucomutase-like phosphatase (HAD superfamily)